MEKELKLYKDLNTLRTPTIKDSVYFVLNSTTQKVNQIWVTNNQNIPKQVDLGGNDFNPSNYDLSEFLNSSGDPFIRMSNLSGVGSTNLAYLLSPTQGTITSDTGTSAIIPLADETNAGLLSPEDKIKLDTINGNQDLQSVLDNGTIGDFDSGKFKIDIFTDAGGGDRFFGVNINNSGESDYKATDISQSLEVVSLGGSFTSSGITKESGVNVDMGSLQFLQKIDDGILKQTLLSFEDPIEEGTVNIKIPAKQIGDYTLATLDDIPSSIVGITGTKSQFNTAVTDGDILYVGDITQYTDELAQDAVGNILTDTTTVDLSYNDGLNTISADIKANSIDATHLSNTINVSEFVNDAGYVTSGGFVPYTGATTNVDLGEFQAKVGQLELDQTPTGTFGVGKVRWNDSDGTIEVMLKGGNVTLQVGQEQLLRVVNKTGVDLLESQYKVVYISGAQGNRLKVDLALANNTVNSNKTIGLVTENITNNNEGFVTTSGLVRDVNTTGSLQSETWADGDVLYVSPTILGGLTNVMPVSPNHKVLAGYVVRAHITQGSIFVKVDTGLSLGEIHDVKLAGTTAGKVLGSTTEGLWENKTIDTILGYTPENIVNKSNSYTVSSSITYASTKALVDGLTSYNATNVKITGNQYIDGIKTFLQTPYILSSQIKMYDGSLDTNGIIGIDNGEFYFNTSGFNRSLGFSITEGLSIFNTNGFSGKINSSLITGYQTFNLPNNSGTLALITDVPSITGKEDTVNKTSSYTISSTITYPNTKALVDGLSTKINGLGNINYIPRFTASNNLDGFSSKLYDNGTFVGVNTNNPLRTFDVNGSIGVSSGNSLMWGWGSVGIRGNADTTLLELMGWNGSATAPALSVVNGLNVLVGTSTDNGVDKLQVNGSISATTYTGSATLTGTPTAPTAAPNTNTTQIATTAFVQSAVGSNVTDAIVDGVTTVAPSQNAVFDALVGKANLASPTFTGNVVVPNGINTNEAVNKGQLNSVSDAIYGVDIDLIPAQSTYSLQLSDANNRLNVTLNFNQNFLITIPDNSLVPFQIGTKIMIRATLSQPGYVTVTGSGVTFVGNEGSSQARIRYGGTMVLTKLSNTQWLYTTLNGIFYHSSNNRLETMSDMPIYAKNLTSDIIFCGSYGVYNSENLSFGSSTGYNFTKTNNYTNSSGTLNSLNNVMQFVPTSGTGIFNSFNLSPTINQTGGANGITRALYINPTLTSAVDFRAIEVTAGKVIIPAGVNPNEAVNKAQLDAIGSSNILTATIILNFGGETNTVVNTISSLLITNSNIKSVTIIPQESSETSLDEFALNGVSFNIENIIDNVSFDIRGTAQNNASGNYTIKYLITY